MHTCGSQQLDIQSLPVCFSAWHHWHLVKSADLLRVWLSLYNRSNKSNSSLMFAPFCKINSIMQFSLMVDRCIWSGLAAKSQQSQSRHAYIRLNFWGAHMRNKRHAEYKYRRDQSYDSSTSIEENWDNGVISCNSKKKFSRFKQLCQAHLNSVKLQSES